MTPNQSKSFSSTDRTESAADIVVRLRDTPNWMRESFGHWKSCTKEYDRAPFDAAEEIERLRAINAELLEALTAIRDLKPRAFNGIPADWNEQIAACEDCQRYKGHPIQNGICDTHRQPIWARERHNKHEEAALGYRAMEIAREALNKATQS